MPEREFEYPELDNLPGQKTHKEMIEKSRTMKHRKEGGEMESGRHTKRHLRKKLGKQAVEGPIGEFQLPPVQVPESDIDAETMTKDYERLHRAEIEKYLNAGPDDSKKKEVA